MLAKEKKEGHRVKLQGGDLWFADLIRQHTGAPGRRWRSGPMTPG